MKVVTKRYGKILNGGDKWLKVNGEPKVIQDPVHEQFLGRLGASSVDNLLCWCVNWSSVLALLQVHGSSGESAAGPSAPEEAAGAGAEVHLWERPHHREEGLLGSPSSGAPQKPALQVWKPSLSIVIVIIIIIIAERYYCLLTWILICVKLSSCREAALHAHPPTETTGVENRRPVYGETSVRS